jgi:hypothetical protein
MIDNVESCTVWPKVTRPVMFVHKDTRYTPPRDGIVSVLCGKPFEPFVNGLAYQRHRHLKNKLYLTIFSVLMDDSYNFGFPLHWFSRKTFKTLTRKYVLKKFFCLLLFEGTFIKTKSPIEVAKH